MVWLFPSNVIMGQRLISETPAFSERYGCNTYLIGFPLERIEVMYVITLHSALQISSNIFKKSPTGVRDGFP